MSRKIFALSIRVYGGGGKSYLVNPTMMQGGLGMLKSVVGTCLMQLHSRSVLLLISSNIRLN